MRIQDDPPSHLTYCLNVHPGETWDENFAAIRDKALTVRGLVGPKGPFALGLRLSRRAAQTLSQPERLDEFRRFLHEQQLYVFTINGFPYGRFHAAPVKQEVYRPDWRTSERRDYTILLAEILAKLLPAGISGSISTVPGSYRQWIRGQQDVAAMVENLTAVAEHLCKLYEQTGREISVALEGEPDCYIETCAEAVQFLTGPMARGGRAGDIIRRHVGVCLDTSHAAVGFEDPAECLDRLGRAGVRASKIQLSAAIRVEAGADAPAALAGFCDEVYLHQVKVRGADGTIRSYGDLPEALGGSAARQGEWRVHFHVPLFFEGAGALESTNRLLDSRFFRAVRQGATEHLEIETYTFDVLPPQLRCCDVTESIAREYQWVLGRLSPNR